MWLACEAASADATDRDEPQQKNCTSRLLFVGICCPPNQSHSTPQCHSNNTLLIYTLIRTIFHLMVSFLPFSIIVSQAPSPTQSYPVVVSSIFFVSLPPYTLANNAVLQLLLLLQQNRKQDRLMKNAVTLQVLLQI